MKYYNIPVFISHMGCHHQCVYCNQHSITGQYEAPQEEDLRLIIENHLETIEADARVEIAFFGGSFTLIDEALQEKYLSIATEYVHAHQLYGIRLSTRPDGIDWHHLDLLLKYPVKTIELGVQSLDESVLRASGRGHGVIEVLKAVNLIKRYGFDLGLQMMLGLPEDTYDRSLYTAEKIAAMKPDFVRIYPTLVLKDTPLAALYERGEYDPWQLDEMLEIASDVLSIFMSQGIPVARFGLYSEDWDIDDNLLAGPYHPALKELVLSRMFRHRLEEVMELGCSQLQLSCSPRDISFLHGHRRENHDYFSSRYGIREINIQQQEDCPRYHFDYNDRRYSMY